MDFIQYVKRKERRELMQYLHDIIVIKIKNRDAFQN